MLIANVIPMKMGIQETCPLKLVLSRVEGALKDAKITLELFRVVWCISWGSPCNQKRRLHNKHRVILAQNFNFTTNFYGCQIKYAAFSSPCTISRLLPF
jgi:hypothetical protein